MGGLAGAMRRAGGVLHALCLCSCALILLPAAPLNAASRSRADQELEAQLRRHIEVLASDDLQGREPGTEGEAKTLRYIARQWYDIGLVSGTNDPGNEWFAPVTMVAREPADSVAQFARKGRRAIYMPAKVLVLTSGRRSLVRDAPMLFVGYARGQDYSRTELAGRVAVVLDGNNADSQDSTRQNALLAAGASAVLTVLDGDRNLDEVAARRQRSGYALAQDSLGGDLEAFISRDAMANVMSGGPHSLDWYEKQAASPDFLPVPLDLSVSMEATTRETTINTHNLIARLPGRNPEYGAVLFLAHWDHFGICAEPPAEDLVCNGAVDNASGVAALTEVARRLSRLPQLDRDVYFLATTGEELGLLGAHAFADNPPLPLSHIVAAFNIDSVAVAPRGTPFAVVGRGMTGLDRDIARVAKAERFNLVDGDAANEFVRRQDGWALLQHDIPAVMVTTAYGNLDLMRAFFDGNYHRPGDDLSHPIELGGAAEDVKMLTALGRWFADVRKVPPTPLSKGAGQGR
ncbi:aminopeptidase [Novosphingobium colocasiae]|uniref:Aminopeptidase n=2 Tax=Novosphingobium colocasiae TaxID=1256513 RepID=A0A918UHC0_9SPHN|nr:aminopeptidase [Novosphingobium colocasiae]